MVDDEGSAVAGERTSSGESLLLPCSESPFEGGGLFFMLMVCRMPHAPEGGRVFSRRGVMRRAIVLACCIVCGLVLGYLAISQDESIDSPFAALIMLLFAFFVFCCMIMNRTMVRAWVPVYPVCACLCMVLGGAFLMHGLWYEKTSAYVLACVAVVFLGYATWFRIVSDRIRSRVGAWALIAVSVVLPMWGLCLLLDIHRLWSFGVCVLIGMFGALCFLQDLWAVDYCAEDNRDARFEWCAAWSMAFDAFLVFTTAPVGNKVVSDDW